MIRKSKNNAMEASVPPEFNANLGLDLSDNLPMTEPAIFEGSPLPVAALAGPNHILRYINPPFCRLSCKTKDDLIGKAFAEVVFWEGCLALLDHVYSTEEAAVHAEPEGTEAHPAGGQVMIHLYPAPRWFCEMHASCGYCFSIAETGSGITSQDRERIYQPFFTTKGERGTGLGLWVSAGMVDRIGGSIRVWSSRLPGDSGTCFSVFLPAGQATFSTLRRRPAKAA